MLFDQENLLQHGQLLDALDTFPVSWELSKMILLRNGGCSSGSNRPSLPQGVKNVSRFAKAYQVWSSGKIMSKHTDIPALGPAKSNLLLLHSLPTTASGY